MNRESKSSYQGPISSEQGNTATLRVHGALRRHTLGPGPDTFGACSRSFRRLGLDPPSTFARRSGQRRVSFEWRRREPRWTPSGKIIMPVWKATHSSRSQPSPLTAENRHVWTALLWQGVFEWQCNAGRCGHVFDLLMRLTSAAGHNAFRENRVPTKSTRSKRNGENGFSRFPVSTGLLHYILSALPNLDGACLRRRAIRVRDIADRSS